MHLFIQNNPRPAPPVPVCPQNSILQQRKPLWEIGSLPDMQADTLLQRKDTLKKILPVIFSYFSSYFSQNFLGFTPRAPSCQYPLRCHFSHGLPQANRPRRRPAACYWCCCRTASSIIHDKFSFLFSVCGGEVKRWHCLYSQKAIAVTHQHRGHSPYILNPFWPRSSPSVRAFEVRYSGQKKHTNINLLDRSCLSLCLWFAGKSSKSRLINLD